MSEAIKKTASDQIVGYHSHTITKTRHTAVKRHNSLRLRGVSRFACM